MRIRVLGCHGGVLPHHGSSGFLINGSVLLDAGTVCSKLSLAEQRKIRHVLVSHIHLDHIKSLPLIAENMIGQKNRRPIVIVSIPSVITEIRRHLFNNHLWPDFTRIPRGRAPFFRLKPIREGSAVRIGELVVKAYSVNHTVPCAGFVIRDKTASLAYSGDTHATTKIWKAAAKISDLKAAFIETSFPDRLGGIAAKSGHLTPSLLLEEFAKIGKPDLPLFVYHMKPRFRREIAREIAKLAIKRTTILNEGMVLTL